MAPGDVAAAENLLRRACGDRLRVGFPLAPLTTFRIGGPAALYLEPEHEADLDAASHAIRDGGIPFAVLGRGSNVLVADDGFPGLVLRLGRGFRWAAREGDRLTAGGAMPLPALAGVALRHDLAGLEFGVAIPATLGGAVRMNAGAHGRQVQDVLERADTFFLWSGKTASLPAAELRFAYRRADLADDGVVIGATLRLRHGESGDIRASMDEARAWRRRTQPLSEPNCGSVFTNPPGDHAARLIEAVGGKGMRAGGAAVSAKHANFIVAAPGTRAVDVLALIERLHDLVRDRAGIELEPEVRLIGSFDGAHV
jgi:UDP-N-acetylmuramate dehydrogenase